MPSSNATGRGFRLRVRDASGQIRLSAYPLLRELLIEDRVIFPDSDCWFWRGRHYRGKRNSEARPMTRLSGKQEVVYRLAYTVFKGAIPPGQCVCHRCDVGACWNPDHLFLGSRRDNALDMHQKGRNRGGQNWKTKTHCPRGHEYTEANTKVYQGRRYCRLCHTIHSRNYARRKTGVKKPRILTDD